MHTSYFQGMVQRKCKCYMRGAKTDSCGALFFRYRNLLCLPANVGECKAPVLDKLHNHSCHALIRQESEQLTGEVTLPDIIISLCQIKKHGTGIFSALKLSRLSPRLIFLAEIQPAQLEAVD